jgi:hypothetical protein
LSPLLSLEPYNSVSRRGCSPTLPTCAVPTKRMGSFAQVPRSSELPVLLYVSDCSSDSSDVLIQIPVGCHWPSSPILQGTNLLWPRILLPHRCHCPRYSLGFEQEVAQQLPQVHQVSLENRPFWQSLTISPSACPLSSTELVSSLLPLPSTTFLGRTC